MVSCLGAFQKKVFANEHAAPAEGGGHGEKNEPPKISPPEWMELQTDIQSLAGKIKAKQDNLIRLFSGGGGAAGGGGHGAPPAGGEHGGGGGAAPAGHGGGAGGGENMQNAAEINKEHKELRDLITEYDKKRTILRYRYPEAGAASDRKYKRIELKSLDELKTETVMEKRLRQTSEKVKKVYNYQDKDKEEAEKKARELREYQRSPASSKADVLEEKIPFLEEEVILKK